MNYGLVTETSEYRKLLDQLRAGARVISVPVNHRPRMRGTSKYGMLNRLWVGIVDIAGVMWLRRRYKSTAPAYVLALPLALSAFACLGRWQGFLVPWRCGRIPFSRHSFAT